MTNLVFIQANGSFPGASASSASLAYSLNTTTASFLLAFFWTNNDSIASISDSLGNTWQQVSNQVVGATTLQVFMVPSNKVGGGANTVTANFLLSANTFSQFVIAEYTGQLVSSPIDVVSAEGGNTGTSFLGTPVTTTFSNETILFWGITTDNPTITGTNGFTNEFVGGGGILLLDAPATALGTYTPTATVSPSNSVFGLTLGLKSSSSALPPVASSIGPRSGVQGQTFNVTVTGTQFSVGSATLSFSGTGVTVNSYSVRTATHITANITISGGAATTARDVTVTNSDGQTSTLSAAFTVRASSSAAPGTPGQDNLSDYADATVITSPRTSVIGTNLGTRTIG